MASEPAHVTLMFTRRWFLLAAWVIATPLLRIVAEQAREHMTQPAGTFRMDHSMGKVAVMHAKLRGWQAKESSDSQPQERCPPHDWLRSEVAPLRPGHAVWVRSGFPPPVAPR